MKPRSWLNRRMKTLLALAPVCFLGTMVAQPAVAAENYALLVAATEYSNLAEKYWLEGPKNDAVLVRDFLINNAPVPFKPENITTLETAPGMTSPTHEAIIASLRSIRAAAQQGDFVYLHFSGHGTQQPATDESETDGRDELFLPSDTMMAGEDQTFPNALTDNEIADELNAIRDKGAFVWAVFDSCHSGTVTRAAPDDDGATDRKIDPADLGIPESAFTKPEASMAERSAPLPASAFADEDNPNRGGLVAFFAAQSTETAQEKNLPIETADGPTEMKFGVFTYTLFTALAKNPGMTYRQLAQSVLAEYTARNSLKPTPMFEGKLDAPVFGSSDAVTTEQWMPLVASDGTITMSAGQLHGLGRGTKLLVLPGPASANDQAIGLVEVASIETLRSTLKPISDDKRPLIAPTDIPKGAYVRLLEQEYNFELAVSRPDPESEGADIINAALDAILADTLSPERAKPLRLKLVDPDQPADVRLAVLSEAGAYDLGASRGVERAALDDTPRLWLLPSSGEISLAPDSRSLEMGMPDGPFSDADQFQADLSANLVTIFRATGLSRLQRANTFKPTDFAFSVGVQKAGATEITTLEAEETPLVNSDDRLYLSLRNSSGKPMDVNVLYIDHDYGITLICKAQLAPNSAMNAPMADLAESDRGAERIVAVINESGKDLVDLSYLAQRGIITRTRDVGDQGLLGLIADLGAGESTRGPAPVASKAAAVPRGAVMMVPLEVLPATGATPAAEIALADPGVLTGDCNNRG